MIIMIKMIMTKRDSTDVKNSENMSKESAPEPKKKGISNYIKN